MGYIYETSPKNYEDFASGKVLYNARGATAFPVRLASEIYLRVKAFLEQRKSPASKITLYDPCCGGAYLLAVLGILHGADIGRIIASDVDTEKLELAHKNLSLVNVDGLQTRAEHIREMIEKFGKDSHRQALESAHKLLSMVEARNTDIEFHVFQADITQTDMTRERSFRGQDGKADFVITDVPYGDIARWSGDVNHPVEALLENISGVLAPQAVVAIVADKKQKAEHPGYVRLERFKAGKRQVTILQRKMDSLTK